MCLSVPAKVLAKSESKAHVDLYGCRKEVFLACDEQQVDIGDWVLVHGNIALHVLEPEAARETIDLLARLREK